ICTRVLNQRGRYSAPRHNEEMWMNAAESKGLKKGNRVYWRGDANDGGIITEMSWDAVTIAWDNGQWPPYTMGTCARSSEREQSLLLCRYCVGRSSASGCPF